MARVLLFGRLADQAGWRERDIPADSLSRLTHLLTLEDPALGEALVCEGVQIALDQALVRGDHALRPETEVAYLPPMSGG